MTEKEHGSVAMGDSRERGAAMATVKDHIAWAVQIMQRGARMRLDGIPDDPTFLSSSFGPDVTAEIARTLTAALSRPVQEPVAKRWLVEETLQGGSIRWKTYEHEHIARMAASGGNKTLTALYAAPQPAHGTSATERKTDVEARTVAPVEVYRIIKDVVIDKENVSAWSRRIATALSSPAPNAATARQGVEVERLLGLIRWAHDTLYEINPSNYDHDEVCKVNGASVEVILGLAVELGEKHGKPDEWWAARSALATPTPKEESK